MGSAVALLDDVTALDAVGPIDVPSRLPGAEVRIVARGRPARCAPGRIRAPA